MKIAILGGAHHETESLEFQLAYNLGLELTNCGHEILAFGSKGVPLAAARGAYKTEIGHTPKCYVDLGDSRRLPHGAACEGSYTENLQKMIHLPDVHIFVDSGALGTHIQMSTLLMYVIYGLKKAEDMKIIVYRPFSQVLLRDVFSFCAKARANMPDCVHVILDVAEIKKLLATS